MKQIVYRKGYKYQLALDYFISIGLSCPLFVNQAKLSPFLVIKPNGELTILKGYSWDGPSGPAFDTSTFMRASLVHDALYQLMRQGYIPRSFRLEADKLMKSICIEDGMSSIRAKYCYWGVRRFAKSAASPKNKRILVTAP